MINTFKGNYLIGCILTSYCRRNINQRDFCYNILKGQNIKLNFCLSIPNTHSIQV